MRNTRRTPSLRGASLCEGWGSSVFQTITGSSSQSELIGHFRGNVLEGDGRAGDSLEPHAVE